MNLGVDSVQPVWKVTKSLVLRINLTTHWHCPKRTHERFQQCPALGFLSLEIQKWCYKRAWMLTRRKDWTCPRTHTHARTHTPHITHHTHARARTHTRASTHVCSHTHTLKDGVPLRSYAPHKNTHYDPAVSLSLSLSLSLSSMTDLKAISK